MFPEIKPVLRALTMSPRDISAKHMSVIERFSILLYNKTSSLTSVNEARQELFSKKSRIVDSISPTRTALVNHAKRAVFQGGIVWPQTLLKEPVLPCPSQCGWQCKGSVWVPRWTTLQQVGVKQCTEDLVSLMRTGLFNCRGNYKGDCPLEQNNAYNS